MARSERSARGAAVVAIAALTMGTAIACNGIVGLDAFDKGECPGARCPGDGGDAGSLDGSNGDAGQADAGPGAAPVSWAKWKMPNYDAGPGTETRAQYQVTGTDVTDQVTKLVWQQPPPSVPPVTYAQAQTSCPAGYRLPSRIELVTLLDLSNTSPRIATVLQPGTTGSSYWTSSEVRPFPNAKGERVYWAVDFGSGKLANVNSQSTALVRCVKGGP